MAKNRKCLCCGEKYSYCPSCSRVDALKESWHSEFCSETCKDLWMTLTKYSMDFLTKSEAKSIISELDLKPLVAYADCVQRDYAKVMAEEKKPKRGKRIEIKPIDEVMDVEPVVFNEVLSTVEESHEVVLQENDKAL